MPLSPCRRQFFASNGNSSARVAFASDILASAICHERIRTKSRHFCSTLEILHMLGESAESAWRPQERLCGIGKLALPLRLRSFNLEDCLHVNSSPLAFIIPHDQRL